MCQQPCLSISPSLSVSLWEIIFNSNSKSRLWIPITNWVKFYFFWCFIQFVRTNLRAHSSIFRHVGTVLSLSTGLAPRLAPKPCNFYRNNQTQIKINSKNTWNNFMPHSSRQNWSKSWALSHPSPSLGLQLLHVLGTKDPVFTHVFSKTNSLPIKAVMYVQHTERIPECNAVILHQPAVHLPKKIAFSKALSCTHKHTQSWQTRGRLTNCNILPSNQSPHYKIFFVRHGLSYMFNHWDIFEKVVDSCWTLYHFDFTDPFREILVIRLVFTLPLRLILHKLWPFHWKKSTFTV